MKTNELKSKIREANKSYRTSDNIISDEEYDNLLDTLKGEISKDDFEDFMNVLSKDVIKDSSLGRKEKLPYHMGSLDKVKTLEEIKKWAKNKGIEDELFILSPKLDGLSIIADENNGKAWTRGDGEIGQKSHDHFKAMNYGKYGKIVSCGEAIMMKKTFDIKYADKFANSRNLVAGQLNSDEPSDILTDVYYIRYNILDKEYDKSAQLELCNKLNKWEIPYEVIKLEDITEELLKNLYENWSDDFTLDGIVIEVSELEVRKRLYKEDGNPDYARAYKGNFEEVKEAKVLDITVSVTKQGLLKPVVVIEPTKLDGATVSNVTAYNFKYLLDNEIGKNSIVSIKRSGQVIPKIVSVIKKGIYPIIKKCPSCGEPIEWNENEVDLICNNFDCPAQRFERILAFFNIMGVEEMGEGIVEKLYNSGYDTIKKILDMKKSDLIKIPGFAERKTDIVYDNIHSKMIDVSLSKLMHATGIFKGLGSKKLVLVCDSKNPIMDSIVSINGFSEKSANVYINGLPKFNKFISNLPITIKKGGEEKMKKKSSKCEGMVVVFTGFRSAEMEKEIIINGGEIGSGVSKNTTHLIMKQKGSGTAKENKAIDLGITIWTGEELADFLGM